MKISRRGQRVPPSPIRKLVPFSEAAASEGVHVHHLNIGQPDVQTPPAFFEGVRAYDSDVLAYGHSAGFQTLRDVMARYYRQVGYAGIKTEHVTVTTGGSEAILFALTTICDQGDNVLCFEPFYTNYNGFSIEAGVELRPLSTDPGTGYHLPSRETIEQAIDEKTRGILLCTPNNPTGTVLTSDEMQMLAQIAKERDLYLLSDEAYREFVYGEVPHTGVLSLEAVHDRAILLDSLSKRYSLCGARIGCLVTRNPELNDAFLRLGQARLCPPSLEQAGAQAMFDLGDAYFSEMQDEYRRRRDVVIEALQGMDGVTAKTPEGAFYVMAGLDIDDAGDFAKWLLTDFRLDGETVMVSPGDGFYATPGKGRSEIRIAYVLEVEQLRSAVKCLREGLLAYKHR